VAVRRLAISGAVLALLIALGACAARPRHVREGRDRRGIDVVLYRDQAVITHHLEVTIPPASDGLVRLYLATGSKPGDVEVVDPHELVVRQIRAAGGSAKASPGPTEIEIVVGAPREGRFPLDVTYRTSRLRWSAAYTMTTLPARDRVRLEGALSIRNTTGLDLRGIDLRVVDARHVPRTDTAERELPSAVRTPVARPLDLGRVDLVEGDTRLALLPEPRWRAAHPVLVYDPFGTSLDYENSSPVRKPDLGVVPPPDPRVAEGLEVAREHSTRDLPAGTVRLVERAADGSLTLLGQAQLFGEEMRLAEADTVVFGTATGITCRRERRDFSIDNDRKRIVEEIQIVVDNHRAREVEVVLREHLYRGENWTIAYFSNSFEKEGKQQIAMRLRVPARQQRTILYAVVYSWGSDRAGR